MESTLSEVAKRIDAKPRSIEHWTDKRILRPKRGTARAGTGKHRRYPDAEVEIAAIIAEISRYSIPFWALLDVSAWLRNVQRRGEAFELNGASDGRRFIAEQRFLNLRKHGVIEGSRADATAFQLDYVPAGDPIATKDQTVELEQWVLYQEAKEHTTNVVLYLAVDEQRWKAVLAEDGGTSPFAEFSSVFLIRISRILSGLWKDHA